jgi:uncharacterized protein YjdB
MREDLMRTLAKHVDGLAIGQKSAKVIGDLGDNISKAGGDFGQNLSKAGDKLLKVWDLNDLKDDTIEYKDHVEKDLKEDTQKIGAQLRPLGEAIRIRTKGLGEAIQAATPR